MVRKRSKGSRRYYESDDEPETESDFEDDPAYEPSEKKYSLRQRKKPTFTSDDFEYEENLLDEQASSALPVDEEFKIDTNETTKETDEPTNSEVAETSEEPPSEIQPSNEVQNELVDFEDMIRADIVQVNKNKIDYDNIIQKSEIKFQSISQSEKQEIARKKSTKQSPNKPKGKRGRKPKRRNDDLDEPQYFAPQIQENESDEDYHPYKPKRTRKPKARPAGEIDSSLLEDVDDYEFEDMNDVDYNPEDDLEYPGLGLSSYILDKQITEDMEDNSDHSNNLQAIANIATSTTCPETATSSDVTSISKETTSKLSESDSPDTTNQLQEVPSQLKESNSTSDKSNVEKVTSTSYDTVIKVNEIANNLHVNGSIKHIEEPEEQTAAEEDDDIIFIEGEKREIIVLDD